jgi:DNA-binding LacI/PurR family transcriptional regulator
MSVRAPTIYHVAKRANVSIATVSRVLNSPRMVSPDTRRKVMDAVEALHFIPKTEARVRARKNMGSIGVLLPFVTTPSFLQRMRGIASVLDATEFELVLYSVSSRSQLDEYLDVLPLWKRLDGLVIMSMPLDENQTRHLRAHELETVCIEFNRTPFCSVEIDNVEGGRMAARHLLAKGSTRFGYVGEAGIPEHIVHLSDLRLSGFKQELIDAGAELRDAYVSRMPYSREGVAKQAEDLLSQVPPPDAVFGYSDRHAAHILRAARQRGIRVPEDLSVIGFDGTDLADYLEMTTIDQGLDESGRLAAELLMARISDHDRPPQHVKLQLTLAERHTT